MKRRDGGGGCTERLLLLGCCSTASPGGFAPRVTPLQPHFGVELHGVSAADPQAPALVADALERHGLVLLRGQHDLTPAQQFNLVLSLPDIDLADAEQSPFSLNDPSCLPGMPGVRALGHYNDTEETEPDVCDGDPAAAQCQQSGRAKRPEQNRIGREYHTDGCGITALHAVQVPPTDSAAQRATAFACGQQAWELLEPRLQRTAAALQGQLGPRHTLEDSVAEMARRGARMSDNSMACGW